MREPTTRFEALEEWMLWTMISGLGWTTALILGKGLVYLSLAPGVSGLDGVISLLIGGVLIALFQLFYLAPDVRSKRLWVLLSALGWSVGAGVTWLLFQTGGSFVRFGWLAGGLVGGFIYGGIQSLGFNPWVTSPIPWMSKIAMQWIMAYATGILVVGREPGLQFFEFLFISWGLLAILIFTFNLLIIPKSHGLGPPEGGSW